MPRNDARNAIWSNKLYDAWPKVNFGHSANTPLNPTIWRSYGITTNVWDNSRLKDATNMQEERQPLLFFGTG
jgi:hypothetical protein